MQMDVNQPGLPTSADEDGKMRGTGSDPAQAPSVVDALRYRDAYERVLAELADLRAVARPEVGEVERLKREMAEIKRGAVEAEQSHAAQAGDLQRRLQRAEAHVQQLTARIAEMERSTSWRLTAPLRLLSTLARRLRGGGPAA